MSESGGRPRGLGRKRAVRVALAGVVVLGLAGWIAKPSVQDWWIARSACDGALPEGVLDDLRSDYAQDDEGHLGEYEERTYHQVGRYVCEVDSEGERAGYRFRAAAWTGTDEVHAQTVYDFSDFGSVSALALPAGLPGWENIRGDLSLVRECPALGEDAAGHPRKLLTRVHGAGYHGVEDSADDEGADEAYSAAARVLTAVSNKASQKLGCGAKPLPVPARVAPPEPVPLARTADTPCAALADAPLPGTGWTVGVRFAGHAPVGSCELRPRRSAEDGDDLPSTALDLTAYYGEWSTNLWLGKRDGIPAAEPWLGSSEGWATARCDGAAAAFRVRADSDSAAPGLSAGELRTVLTGFARDRTASSGPRDCTGLRLPVRVPEKEGAQQGG